MLKFICFGSGSSGNCYYLLNEHGGVFVDIGVGILAMKKHFYNYGVNQERFRAILLTHDHSDHTRAVGSIAYKYNLPVWATEKVHKGLDEKYLVKHKIDRAAKRIVTVGEEFTVCEMKVTAISVPHDASDNVAYRIEYEGLVFAIITDVGHMTEPIGQLISEADYLVMESNHDENMLIHGNYPPHLKTRILSPVGHISNRQCAEALVKYASDKLKHVWLCHLSAHNNEPRIAAETVGQILKDNHKELNFNVLDRKIPTDWIEIK